MDAKKKKLFRWRGATLYMLLFDIFSVNLAFGLALWIRYDCRFSAIPDGYLHAWLSFVPIYAVVCIVVYYLMKLYNSIWKFASFDELTRSGAAVLITAAIHTLAITLIFYRMPLTYYVLGTVFQFVCTIGIRFSVRYIQMERKRLKTMRAASAQPRVMLIGAGLAGRMLLRDMLFSNVARYQVLCIIDDDKSKWYRSIDGIPVVGGRDDILFNVKKFAIDKIFVAIPSASAQDRRDILNICKETGCELKNLPGIYQLVNDEVTVSSMKDVDIEDLLGREPIRVNTEEVLRFTEGKTILVTGGGGSIGSELCRQIAAHSPKKLIIFDIYENSAYDLQMELMRSRPELDLEVLIGSVRDSRRVLQVFRDYRPDIVYHAAAHKHVPLMEASPCEAIKNNALGTYKTAYAAMLFGCSRFVLISTDKAVNPTNIMGASKRICEMIVQSFDRMIKEGRVSDIPALYTQAEDGEDELFTILPDTPPKTEFVAVRFGNVLGSNGSVIPLFKRQIAAGGPVTVTHPDIIRYFMTIPEAVSLVLQADVYAKGGEVFVLDMGSPVKIDTLARNLIKLSGYKPDEDIKIVYTGLRPGEKLYEEKLMDDENITKTANDLIYVGHPIDFDADDFLKRLGVLLEAAYRNDGEIKQLVEDLVPTYCPAPNSSDSIPEERRCSAS